MKHTIRLSKCCRANIILTIPTGFEKCGTCGKLCQIENIPVTPDEDIAEVLRGSIKSVINRFRVCGDIGTEIINSIAEQLNIKP